MNLFIAVAFVAGLNMSGMPYAPLPTKIATVVPQKPAARAGLQPGDVIVAINGEPMPDFEDVRLVIVTHAVSPLRFDYLRGGQRRTTTLTPVAEQGEFGIIGIAGITPFYEPVVERRDAG